MKRSQGRRAFDRLIKVFRSTPIFDEIGMPDGEAEEKLLEAWAIYAPISDREKLTHGEGSSITARFIILWSQVGAEINGADALEFEGQRYGVFGIKEIERRRFLEITAEALREV